MSGDVSVVTNAGVRGERYQHSVGSGQGCCYNPTRHRQPLSPPPPTSSKDLPGPKCQECCGWDSLLWPETEMISSNRIFHWHSNRFPGFLHPFDTLLFHDLNTCYLHVVHRPATSASAPLESLLETQTLKPPPWPGQGNQNVHFNKSVRWLPHTSHLEKKHCVSVFPPPPCPLVLPLLTQH